jgi:hypothetical protein
MAGTTFYILNSTYNEIRLSNMVFRQKKHFFVVIASRTALWLQHAPVLFALQCGRKHRWTLTAYHCVATRHRNRCTFKSRSPTRLHK